MKFGLISDLHLDVSWYDHSWFEDTEPVDLIILAGDVHPRAQVRQEYIAALTRIAPVFFIPGNHDFWGTEYPAEHEIQRAIDLNGIKIVGAPLWTDLKGSWYLYINGLNDYRFMGWYGWEKEKYQATHKADKAHLMNAGADIVVSHHGPSHRSVHDQWKGHPLNVCFVNELDNEILNMENPPKFWIHGHVHDAFDYMIGKTRVICNPRGYPGERNWKGYKMKVFEIDNEG